MNPTIVVVGAGISGLAVSYELRERIARQGGGVELLCLEGSARPGGNIRSEREAGFLCEWGPNGFLDDAPATLDLVRRLGVERRLLRSSQEAARRFVFRAGKLRRLPERPAEFLTSDILPFPARLRVLSEVFRRAPASTQDDESVFDFAARRIGVDAASVLVDAMVSGIHAGDARQLSARACFPKMLAMEAEHGSLIRAMISRGSGPGPRGRLTSLLDGMQELTDHLAMALTGALRTGSRVTRISATGTLGFRVQTEQGSPIDAAGIVIACPAWAAAELVAGVDDELARTLSAIPQAPIAVVHLGFDEQDLGVPLHGFGFLVPRRQGPRILGALWSSSIFAMRAPAGKALVTVMIGGALDPAALELPDDRLLNVVQLDLRATMGLSATPRLVRIVRHPRGIPQYTLGHAARLATIDRRLAAHPGLAVCGNSYRGISVNACIEEAPRIAEAALAAMAIR